MTANVGDFRPIRQEFWIFSSTRESHPSFRPARNRLLGRRNACVGFACLKDGAMKKIAATLLLVIVSSVLAGARPGNFTPYTLDRMRSEFLSVDIPFSSYHSSTLGADRTGATK
jgi:hypothetical protein